MMNSAGVGTVLTALLGSRSTKVYTKDDRFCISNDDFCISNNEFGTKGRVCRLNYQWPGSSTNDLQICIIKSWILY